MIKKLKKLLQQLRAAARRNGKQVKSFIVVGDVIQVEIFGMTEICKVKQIEILPNSRCSRPTDLVIHCVLSYGESSIEFTSDHFKYIRHINP